MTPSDQVRQAIESRVGHMRETDKMRLVAEVHRFMAMGHKLEELTILFEGGAHIGLVESLAKPVRPQAARPAVTSAPEPPKAKPARKRGRPAKKKQAEPAPEPEAATT